MGRFVLKELVTESIESELEKIGFDSVYRAEASDKYLYKNIKIYKLSIPQANILKQTALSIGADCAVHRDILTANVEKTDVILGGSISQIKKICKKIESQPFSMKFLAEDLLSILNKRRTRPKIVGILNITPNSFSDGGLYFSPKEAERHLFQMVEDGADMIDIGAESTKPFFALAVSPQEQIERLKPVFKNLPEIPVSIDTRNSDVAMFALDNGASIINDVSGLSYDIKMADVVSRYNAGIVIQHSTIRTEEKPHYNDVVEDVWLFLYNRLQIALEKGINNIILDPGIGFGKSKENNYEILNRIEEFYSLDRPIMVGVSRKSLLGLEKSNDNDLKDALSLAVSYPLMQKGVDYLRVHNVKLHNQLLNSAI